MRLLGGGPVRTARHERGAARRQGGAHEAGKGDKRQGVACLGQLAGGSRGLVRRFAGRLFRRLGGRFDQVHALASVVGVLVLRDDLAVERQLLERHDGTPLEARPIEAEDDLDRPVGLLGREANLDREGRAVLLHGLRRVAVNQRARQDVLDPGLEVLVAHLVDDGHVVVGLGLVVPVVAVGRGCPDFGRRPREAHGLPLVLEVLVGGDQGAFGVVELLEDDGAPAFEGAGVELEGDHGEPAFPLGDEIRLRHDRPVAGVQGLARLRVHEDALDPVGLPFLEPAVEDLVVDARGSVGGRHVVPVGGVGRHRPDLGRRLDGHRLVGVQDVCVLGDDLAVEQDLLEHHYVDPGKPGRVELEFHLHRARGGDGRERLLGDDLLAIDDEGLSRCLVDQSAARRELLEGHVGVRNLVDDDGVSRGRDGVVAVGLVERHRVDSRLGDVVHGPQVYVHRGFGGVPVHVERVGPEGVPLVHLAAHLLDRVLAVGKRAEGVVGRGLRAVLARSEPDAGAFDDVLRVDVVLVNEGVVRVHRLLAAAPFRRRGQHAVPVGDGDVGLAGGDVGDEERDEPELLSVDGPLLLEMHVVAHHLVAPQQRSAVHVRGHHDAVAADLERAGLAVGEQVALVGRRLDDGDDAARGIVGPADHDAVLGHVGDGEPDPLEGGSEIPVVGQARVVGSA